MGRRGQGCQECCCFLILRAIRYPILGNAQATIALDDEYMEHTRGVSLIMCTISKKWENTSLSIGANKLRLTGWEWTNRETFRPHDSARLWLAVQFSSRSMTPPIQPLDLQYIQLSQYPYNSDLLISSQFPSAKNNSNSNDVKTLGLRNAL